MANENTGTSKLKERILAAAEAEASAIAAEAKTECDEIGKQTERLLAQNEKAFEKEREDAAKAILERSRTNAELAARKDALAKRRGLIDKAFEEAQESITRLPDGERIALYKKLLENEAEGGETVYPGKNDRSLLEKAIQEISGVKLSLGKEDADVAYGFVLKGAGFEKDCSLAAILRDCRAQEETGVAKILFD